MPWVFAVLPRFLRWPVRLLWLACIVALLVVGVRWLASRRWSWKGILFSAIMLGIVFASVHVACAIFMRVMGSRDSRLALRGETSLSEGSRKYIEDCIAAGDANGGFDKRIGWVPLRGQTTAYGTINAQGFRALHEYPVKAPDESKRVLCLGDSFTLGVGVPDDQTYPFHAEQWMPGSEWLNFGISGGCLAQAYLHYQENARRFGGKYVIIGFMTDDAQRTVNCFRPFTFARAGTPMTKPFAHLDEHGVFSIKPNPYQSLDDYRRLLSNEAVEIHKLLRQDYLTWGRTGSQTLLEMPIVRTFTYTCDRLNVADRLDDLLDHRAPVTRLFKQLAAGDLYGDEFWSEDSRGFQAVCAMFDLFHSTVIKDGRTPVILIMPSPRDVSEYSDGRARRYQTLIDFLKRKRFRYLDFLDPLVAKHHDDLSEDALFVVRHFRGDVNRELAQEVVRMVQSSAAAE